MTAKADSIDQCLKVCQSLISITINIKLRNIESLTGKGNFT